MDFDKLIAYILDKYKPQQSTDKNQFFKNIKDTSKEITDFINEITKKPEIKRKDIVQGFNSFIDDYNSRPENSNNKIKYKLDTFSRSEIKNRRAKHETAKSILANCLANINANRNVMRSFNIGLGEQRPSLAMFTNSAKNLDDLYEACQAYNNRANDPRSKQKFTDYIKNGLEQCKNVIDKLATNPGEDGIIKFLSDNNNLRAFQMMVELQPGVINEVNSVLDLGLDEQYMKNWNDNYAKKAVDFSDLRLKIFAMSNPLYPETSEADIKFITYNIIDTDSSPKWFDDMLNKTKEYRGLSGDDYNLSHFSGYVKNSSIITYKKLEDAGLDISNAMHTKTIKNSLNFLKYKELGSSDKECIFRTNNNETVSLDVAAQKLYNGESINMLDQNGNFISKLENDPYSSNGYIKLSDSSNLVKTDIVLNSRKKNDKLFKEVGNLEDKISKEKNPKKLAKLKKELDKAKGKIAKQFDQVQKDVHKDFNSTAKDLFKETKGLAKKEKHNKKAKEIVDLLEELKDDKSRYLQSKTDLTKEIASKAKQYIDNKMKSGEPLSKVDNQIIKVYNSMKDVDSKLNDYYKSLDVFDLKKEEVKKEALPERVQIQVNLDDPEINNQQAIEHQNQNVRVDEINTDIEISNNQ